MHFKCFWFILPDDLLARLCQSASTSSAGEFLFSKVWFFFFKVLFCYVNLFLGNLSVLLVLLPDILMLQGAACCWVLEKTLEPWAALWSSGKEQEKRNLNDCTFWSSRSATWQTEWFYNVFPRSSFEVGPQDSVITGNALISWSVV